MLWVPDLGDGINQGTLLVRLEYNVEVDSGASGWVTQSFPVDWNVIPGVLSLRVVPRNDGCREIGEGTATKKKSIKNYKCCMSTGGQRECAYEKA